MRNAAARPRALAAAVAVLALAAAAGPAPAVPKASDHMFNARYCEVLEVRGTLPGVRVVVWNTLGLNHCPPAQWAAMDAATVAAEAGATAVVLNGPRYFVMDRASVRNPGPVRSFGGMRMRRLATIPVRTAADLQQRPYAERVIARRNTFTWAGGRRIFELVAPGGRRYVMQAYSQIVDPALSLRSLPGLGRRLRLPPGWRYTSRRLRRDLSLTATGRAIVAQDELQNTYQYEDGTG